MHWTKKNPPTKITPEVAREFNLSPLMQRLFENRGLVTQDQINYWVNAGVEQLADPMDFNEMDQAVERIFQALDQEEKITIYGDYDADGITSTTVLVETLQILGANVDYYIPSRFVDGYGPNLKKYQELIQNGTQLIITVDNGITGNDEVAFAKEQGVDVIVTDHHTIGANIPAAIAVIHPKLADQKYPYHDFSGVGVAYNLARALMDGDYLEDLLDLVAIGTVADLVPLTGENHLLVKSGLEIMHQNNRLGLNQLLAVAKINPESISETDIGFGIAPRLNSIGRIDDANLAVKLLLSEDENEARKIAEKLDLANQKRKELADSAFLVAKQQIIDFNLDEKKTLVIYSPDFHEGILGIVASKLVGEYHKPTIVLTKSGDKLKGSGRSVEEFDIYEALKPFDQTIFTSFGGHTMACGLSLPASKLPEFIADFENVVTKPFPVKEMSYDAALEIDDITIDLIDQLKFVGPFGTDNPEPIFMIESPQISDFKRMGKSQEFFRFNVLGSTQKVAAINFDLPNFEDEIVPLIDKIYVTLGINEWNNQKSPQLMIVDFDFKNSSNDFNDLRQVNTIMNLADEYLFFEEKTRQRFLNTAKVDAQKVKLVSDDLLGQKAALMELPKNPQSLAQVMQEHSFSQVYLKFSYNNFLVDQMPSDEDFKKVLKYLMSHPGLTTDQLNETVQYLQINLKSLKFILNVFIELKFVKLDKDEILVIPQSDKVALSSSKLVQLAQQELAFQEKMQQISSADLITYLKSLRN